MSVRRTRGLKHRANAGTHPRWLCIRGAGEQPPSRNLHLTTRRLLPIRNAPMRRIFQFTALVVLALWLPTTVHCNLEAVFAGEADDCCGDHADGGSAPVEHCGV